MEFNITIRVDENGKMSLENANSNAKQRYDSMIAFNKERNKSYWSINSKNSHLIGLEADEFERLLGMSEVQEIKINKNSIARDEYYALIKRQPQILEIIRNEVD